MVAGQGAAWARWVGRAMVVVALPLLGWLVLVEAPLNTVRGVAGVFSGRDVVQTADALDTGLTLTVIVGATGALLAWCIPWLRNAGLMVLVYGTLGLVPLGMLGGLGGTYVLQWVLAARGYSYCGRHVVALDRGESGPSAYARPGDCTRVRAMFPPHTPVPGNTGTFDWPPG